eukprot:jgi/Tetstr1/432747/TSEL_022113.t1
MRPPKPGKGKKKIKTTDEGGRGKYKKYTSADMVNAVSAVVNGTHSFRAAVQSFRVPKTSLQRNVATARKARSMTSFSNLVIFTEEEEAQMVAAIIRRGKAALPWTVKALRRKVLEVVKYCSLAIKTDRQQNIIQGWIRRGSAGKDWFRAFLNRHRDELSVRCSDKLERKRWMVTWKSACSTYEILRALKVEFPGLHPALLMNLDETSFRPDGRAQRVVTYRGAKQTHSLVADGRWSITLIPFIFGDGSCLPPVAILRGSSETGDPLKDLPKWWFDKKLQEKIANSPMKGMVLAVQKKGYNDSRLNQLIWEKHVLPYTERLRSGPSPLVVILDNFSGHCDPWLIKWLDTEHNVKTLGLPPHSSHFSQPLDLESNAEISRTFTVVAEARLEASGAKELTESECISLLCSKSTLLKATVTDSYGNKLVIPACSPWEKAVSKERNRRSFERAGYPNGDTRQWDVNPEAIRNKVYQTIKEQKEGGAITAVNTIAQTEGAAEPETAIESILDSNVTGIPSDPLQLLAHVVCVSGLPDVKSAAVKRTYQQIMHHQRETERLRQELIVQNLPEHPPICEVLALTPDKDKCSKRYKMPGRRRIMGEDAQMLCGERAMRALFTKWLKKTVGHALRRWRAMAKETARHKLAQERARDKEHHARRMAQKAAIRVQVKARAEMEKRRAAAAAKAEKAARQAERKRAEAAARRVAAAAKAAAKNKALLEKEDEKLRQAAQKEARATDAITEQQEVLDGLQASMALATEHTQNTTEVRSALYMDCCLHGE